MVNFGGVMRRIDTLARRYRAVRALCCWPGRCVDGVRVFRAATRFQLGDRDELGRLLAQ